ncbi:MAG: hypothetical protein AB1Z20_00085, partial [Desulfobacterales bacterium]
MKTARARETASTAPTQDTSVSPSGRYGEVISILIKDGIVKSDQVAYAERIRSKLEGNRTLVQVLKELKSVDDEQIRHALQKNRVSMNIGNLLMELGYIAKAELARAVEIQKANKTQKKLSQILVEQNFIDERELLDVVSLQLGLPAIDPEFLEIDRRLFAKVPDSWFISHKLIPVRADEEGKVVVAFA